MNEIPAIGFGTWQIPDGAEAVSAVTCALESGYRLIDTAKIYGNEASVGQAVAASDIPREQIFVTTKLWTSDQGYGSTLKAFEASLQRLGLDYVDLYLIHWPGHERQKRLDSWKAMIEIKLSGRAKAIGVSNYEPEHLQELLDNSAVPPAVNQIEFHPFIFKRQKPTLDFCDANGIVVEAYSPLARGKINNDEILKLADKYEKSPAQIMLRWAIGQGTVPIPKSTHPDRIKQNLDIFDFELLPEDMRILNSLSTD